MALSNTALSPLLRQEILQSSKRISIWFPPIQYSAETAVAYFCKEVNPYKLNHRWNSTKLETTSLEGAINFHYFFLGMTKNVLDPTITNWIKFNEDLMKLGLTSFVKQVTGYFSLFCYNNIMILKHFPHYRPLVRGLHQSLMESPNKGPCNMELWCNFC